MWEHALSVSLRPAAKTCGAGEEFHTGLYCGLVVGWLGKPKI